MLDFTVYKVARLYLRQLGVVWSLAIRVRARVRARGNIVHCIHQLKKFQHAEYCNLESIIYFISTFLYRRSTMLSIQVSSAPKLLVPLHCRLDAKGTWVAANITSGDVLPNISDECR